MMLEIQNLCKSYPGFSLRNICLSISEGEYFVLLGPSGSGKSMLLDMIAGIKRPDSGRIILRKHDITSRNIQKRNAILLHQDTNLFPHLTVFENIAYPLRCRKQKNDVIKKRVAELAEIVSVTSLLHRHPSGLSGGEAQRVALARALAVKPDILLLDEPLAALDVQLHAELKSLLHKINISGQTILHVTHHFDEAVSLADRLAVIDQGEIIQQGTTEELVTSPRSAFVARLAGIRNFYPVGSVYHDNDESHCLVKIQGKEINIRVNKHTCPGDGFLMIDSGEVSVTTTKPHPGSHNLFRGVVLEVVPGVRTFDVIVDAEFIITSSPTRKKYQQAPLAAGTNVWVSFNPSACRIIRKD